MERGILYISSTYVLLGIAICILMKPLQAVWSILRDARDVRLTLCPDERFVDSVHVLAHHSDIVVACSEALLEQNCLPVMESWCQWWYPKFCPLTLRAKLSLRRAWRALENGGRDAFKSHLIKRWEAPHNLVYLSLPFFSHTFLLPFIFRANQDS